MGAGFAQYGSGDVKSGVQGPQAPAGVWGRAPSPVPQHSQRAFRAAEGRKKRGLRQIVCFLRRACGAQAAFHKGRGARRAPGATEGHDPPGEARRKGRARGGGLTRRRAAAAPGPRDRSPGTACRARPAGRGSPEGGRVTELAAQTCGGGSRSARPVAGYGLPGTTRRARLAGRRARDGTCRAGVRRRLPVRGTGRRGRVARGCPRLAGWGGVATIAPDGRKSNEIPHGIEVKQRDDAQ